MRETAASPHNAPVPSYAEITADLRRAYDRMADQRESKAPEPWKIEERNRFLAMLHKADARSLLEVGAGTGVHGKFFQEQGIEVVCTDLSPEMVRLCRAKGLTAHLMDFLSLDFPAGAFDAAFAMNTLLHVPRRDLARVLAALYEMLKRRGLFYLGQYGGFQHEGVWPNDDYEPKRFFSYLPDDEIKRVVANSFELVRFDTVAVERDSDFHYQSLILRRG